MKQLVLSSLKEVSGFFGDRDGRWVLDDTYVLGMIAPRPGYEVFFRQPYFSWLGMETREIYVFKRDTAE